MVNERLDRLLVSRGLVSGRRQAYAVIVGGTVRVDGITCRKPDHKVASDARIDYEPLSGQYVSRGGLKLEKALDVFSVGIAGRTVLDVGASTGGFTDCLLKRGAVRVIAVDVGYGQLAWKLRQDERVTVLERINARYLEPDQLPERASLATIDISFISLEKVMPAVIKCISDDGQVLALVKPQFEIGKGRVGRTGVVKASNDHLLVLSTAAKHIMDQGLSVLGLSWSPIRGPKGNIEFWLYLSKQPSVGYASEEIDAISALAVKEAHAELNQ